MPIYEYYCSKCQHKFEQLKPISRCNEDVECPKCKMPAKRAISKFVSRVPADLSYLSHMQEAASSGGNSCSSCTSSNCSTCGM